MIIGSVGRWVGGRLVGGSVSKWSVVGWSVVGGSVVGGFNKTPLVIGLKCFWFLIALSLYLK